MVSVCFLCCACLSSFERADSVAVYTCWYAGTERCNEALQKLEKKYDIVVNIQGDEPLIEPEIIDGIVKALQVKLVILISFLLLD